MSVSADSLRVQPIGELVDGTPTALRLYSPAGDPLDVFVNDRLVAHGEVIMVNDRYGVRFTEPVDAADVHR